MPQKAWNTAVLAMKKPFSYGWEKGMSGGYEIRTHATPSMHLSETCGSLFELPTEHGFTEHSTAWRIRLVVYGARLESVLV